MSDARTRRLFELGGKVALVTGGGRGLGFQAAEALADLGARVAVVALEREEVDAAAERLGGLGVVADVTDRNAIGPLLGEVAAALGPVDILVNNAGTSFHAPSVDYPAAAWDRIIGLNLTAAFSLSQAVARHFMLPRSAGRIINMASVSAFKAADPQYLTFAAYNASKGGLVSLTRTLAAEWASRGVTVNALAPGFFHTRLSERAIEMVGERILATCPMRRFGDGDDLKGATALLASEAGAYITGQVLAIDGGMSLT